MLKNVFRVVSLIAAVVICGISLWFGLGANRANKLVEEANAGVNAGNLQLNQIGDRYANLFTDERLQGFPGNREELRDDAQASADLLAQAAEHFRQAAAKFDQASQQAVNSTASSYWKLHVQSLTKLAESKESYRQAALLFLNEEIVDATAFSDRLMPLLDKARADNDEHEKLDAEAQKLHDDNKGKFDS